MPDPAPPTRPSCRLCGEPLHRVFADLGLSPLCETYPGPDDLDRMEPFHPLKALVCDRCLLVQLGTSVSPAEIFLDYPYFSSYSTSWIEHGRRFAERAVRALELGPESLVLEVASNDGYLLQHFRRLGVPVLGVDPARNVARAARARGIPTVAEFFGMELARVLSEEGRHADLVIGNNVLAHVPEPHDLVAGVRDVLAPGGRVTMEFPHLLRLVRENQFDTIYHEHFSYLSLFVVEHLFLAHSLRVFHVEELPTHGGSLRIHAGHADEAPPDSRALEALREKECSAGMLGLRFYEGFGERVQATRRDLLDFLLEAHRAGKRVVGYGAPGKGNTLLNYCGVRPDDVEFTVDRNPHKQGRFLPGTRIPIFPPERLDEARPDYVLVLPWNLKEEIMEQLAELRTRGTRFVVPIPSLEIL